jgi:hypothetical protein
MNREPDFRELVGEDLSPEERARLERVHELLVTAGPPPELPPELADPALDLESPIMLPRRRAGAILALAAALALVAFLGGYLAGKRNSEKFDTLRSLPMHGTFAAERASATIDIGNLDKHGNWPLKVAVRGLPSLPRNGYYEMFLTKNGKPSAPCGTFVVNGQSVTVRLNAPYDLSRFNGWIVTRELPHDNTHQVVLTT